MNSAFWLALFVMLVGTAGTFLPVIPGTPLIFAAALGYAYYEGFHQITPLTLAGLFVVMLLALAVDYWSGVAGAKKYGATKSGLWGAFCGAIVGVVFLNIPGLLIGPFAGAVVGEMIAGRRTEDALRAGFGTLVGLAGGAFLKVCLALVMVAVFVLKLI